MKDVSRMVYTVADMLDHRHAPGAAEFRAISGAMLPKVQLSLPLTQTTTTKTNVAAAKDSFKAQKQLHTLAEAAKITQQVSSSPTSQLRQPLHSFDMKTSLKPSLSVNNLAEVRRMSQPTMLQRRPSSIENLNTKIAIKEALQRLSPPAPVVNPNLDYLQFKHPGVQRPAPRHSVSAPPPLPVDSTATTRWDALLDSYIGANADLGGHDSHHLGLQDIAAVYPGPSTGYIQMPHTTPASGPPSSWSPELWAYNLDQMHVQSHIDQSLGFSDESLTSGSEDFSTIDTSSNGSGERVLTNSMLLQPGLQQDAFGPHHFNAADLDVLNYW